MKKRKKILCLVIAMALSCGVFATVKAATSSFTVVVRYFTVDATCYGYLNGQTVTGTIDLVPNGQVDFEPEGGYTCSVTIWAYNATGDEAYVSTGYGISHASKSKTVTDFTVAYSIYQHRVLTSEVSYRQLYN